VKILIIGVRGSTGNRYAHILKRMGHEIIGWDMAECEKQLFPAHDKCIVAAPTKDHFDYLLRLIQINSDVLCEKPVVKSSVEVALLSQAQAGSDAIIYSVCNWQYTLPNLKPKSHVISYNYFNCGRDLHAIWDLVQPFHLSKLAENATSPCQRQFTYQLTSPVFNCTIDNIPISQRDIDLSYVYMLEDWIDQRHGGRLWRLDFEVKDYVEDIHNYMLQACRDEVFK
jgi:hypothetical protein